MDLEQSESHGTTVGSFFDSLKEDYTRVIERCFPRYREMLWALLDYLPDDRPYRRVLELGCGTGNLSVLVADKYDDAEITFVDLAGESLEVCRSRLANDDRFRYQQADFRKLQIEPSSFDLIVSSIAVHHLTSSEKQALFQSINSWLTDDGIFGYVDQFAGETDDVYQRHVENWRQLSMQAGSSADEWQMWMQHQAEHDHHDTLADQASWLRNTGFEAVDCVWRYLLWTVLQARK